MVEIFPIEMRNDDEVTALHGVQMAPSGIGVLNPHSM